MFISWSGHFADTVRVKPPFLADIWETKQIMEASPNSPTEPPNSAPIKSLEERVAEAISTGVWKERVAPNGKKYFVHAKTKKSVWNLAKELEAASSTNAAAPSAPSFKEVREERFEKARRRQEEESQLNNSVAQLERQKIKLENEIAILQGPVEAEAAAIEELKRQLADQKQSVDLVAKEVATRRKERLAELNAMEEKVRKLEAAKANEAVHQDSLKKRHMKLTAESQDLRADILREQATAEALRQSTRASELKLGQANEELARLQRQVDHKKEVLQKLEGDVVVASKEKAEVEERVAELQKQVSEIRQRVEKRRQLSFAQTQLEAKKNGSAGELDILASLMEKVEQRRRTVKQLKQRAKLAEDVMSLETSTTMLKQLLLDARRDATQLEQLHRVIERQTASGAQLLAEYKAQAIQLKQELSASLAGNGTQGFSPPSWTFAMP